MKTRYGVSPWIEGFPRARRPDFPRLRGELTADVVIMGAGLTGCATAYMTAASGLKTILVDADRIGQGSAGRGAGLLLPEPGPSFQEVTGSHGLRLARRIFESWHRASSDAASHIKRLGIRCRLESQGSLIVAGTAEATRLKKDQLARETAGLDARWLTDKHVRLATGLEAAGGMRLKDGFSLDPYAACLGLATAAAKKRGMLFERSPVRKVRTGQKAIEVLFEGGLVRANTLVVATGSPTAEFKPLRRHFTGREAYLVLTEPAPAAMLKSLGKRDLTLQDAQTPRHRLIWTHDGRILIAGADQDAVSPRLRDAVLVQRTGQLMYELLMMYPSIAGLRPEYGWSLPYGETADRLMFIGPHRNYPRHLFALGSGGDSATGAFLAARILTRALHGAPQKGDDDLGWARRLS
jgi:glycine/D-amino acid oxidase-like deaminating enzyme